MPDAYIEAAIEFDEDAIYNNGIARIQTYFPNWVPRPGSMIDILLRTCAGQAAIGAEVASDVPYQIFRAFGPLAHVPPIDALSASVNSTWTARDAIGYTIPANTPVGITTAGSTDNPIGFWTLEDVDIPPGSTTVDITLVAVNEGADGSNLDTVVRTDSLGFITGIVLDGVTTGGQDAELDDDYINRLSQEFETWSTTPIKGRDFALIARQIVGVFRCGYIENYNPVDNTYNNDKMVALCPLDVDGNDTSSGTRVAVAALMESLREVNFICNVIASTRSTIDVEGTAHVSDSSMITQATADIATALAGYLNPATWGIPTDQQGENPIWISDNTVRISKIMAAIENTANVDYSGGVEIRLSGGAFASADLVMAGAFPLPVLGAVTVSVVSP